MHTLKSSITAGVLLLLGVYLDFSFAAVPVSLHEVGTIQNIPGIPSSPVGSITNLAVDAEHGTIYLLAEMSNRITEIDTFGQVIRRFGEDLTPPDTLDEPSDIMVFRGFVWVLDHAEGRIFQFTRDGRFLGTISTRTMPFSLTGSGDDLFCSQALGSDRIIPYNMYTGETRKGYSRKLSKFAVILGFLKIFGKLVFVSGVPSGDIIGAYMYKNLVVKYDENLEEVKQAKLTDRDIVVRKASKTTAHGGITFFAGTQYAKDICFSDGNVYIPWSEETKDHIPCQGKTYLDVFDLNLHRLAEIPLEACLDRIDVTGDKLIGIERSAKPILHFYEIQHRR